MGLAAASAIRDERRGDVHVLHLPQRLTIGESTQDLQQAVRQLGESGSPRVVLDLADTSYIDSAGIGALVSAYSTVRSSGGSFALANVPKRVADLLQITKLLTVFSVYRSVDEAVAGVER